MATAEIIAHCDKCGRAYVALFNGPCRCLVHGCGGTVRLDAEYVARVEAVAASWERELEA